MLYLFINMFIYWQYWGLMSGPLLSEGYGTCPQTLSIPISYPLRPNCGAPLSKFLVQVLMLQIVVQIFTNIKNNSIGNQGANCHKGEISCLHYSEWQIDLYTATFSLLKVSA
jgi:hypothetical protein